MAGPTIRRRQLGIELRRLRDAVGVSRENAAGAIGAVPSKITHIEQGRNAPNKAELIVLLQLYGSDKEHLDALEEIRLEASKRGWWSQYRLPEWLAGYVGLEADAIAMRVLGLELVPGLLQTEEYARELHVVGRHMTPTDQVERRVAARMKRQARLTDEQQPLQLRTLVSEGALRRCAAHTNVAVDQLQHLLNEAKRPNVELQVIPFGAGLLNGLGGMFSILSFPEGLLPDVAYQEYAIGGHLIDDSTAVSQLSTLHDELRGQALGDDESLAMIAELLSTARR